MRYVILVRNIQEEFSVLAENVWFNVFYTSNVRSLWTDVYFRL